MAVWPLQWRHEQVPTPRESQELKEAAGWMCHTHCPERENKWHSSVLSLSVKRSKSFL